MSLKNDLNQSITQSVRQSLHEDIGEGDITADLIANDTQLEVRLICREKAILCGTEWFNSAFLQIDPDIDLRWSVKDGDAVEGGQILCDLQGHARSLLTAERTALNFLQTLSATATQAHYYQNLISHTKCQILDTRKTLPGLRLGQKYAVRCGGGLNHRMGLYDAFLLKENHLASCSGMAAAVKKARRIKPDALLEIEVETLTQLQQAIATKVDRILLDNFTIAQLKEAVKINNGRVELDASGNITDQNIIEIAQTGVDFISIGALTKHIRAIDFSLRHIG